MLYIRKRLAAVLSLIMVFACCMPVQSFASVDYMPGVTKAMTEAEYWADKLAQPDRVLKDVSDIDAVNSELNSKLDSGSFRKYDLKTWTETVEKVDMVNDMLNSVCADAAYNYYYDGARVTKTDDGRFISCGTPEEAWTNIYESAVINCIDPEVLEWFGDDVQAEVTEEKARDCYLKWIASYSQGGSRPDAVDFRIKEGSFMKENGYAVCTRRSALLGYPTKAEILDEKWSDTSGDSNFDYKYHTAVRVNEPMVVLMKSLDGDFFLVRTSCMTGWISAEDIGICDSRDEWLQAFDYGSDDSLVVYGDRVYTETSKTDPATSQVQLTMGTKLRLASKDEYSGLITNRATYNNYVVWLPTRTDEGNYKRVLALISENRKVCEGYLPLTYRNIYRAALSWLGDTYGWGGGLDSNDCSGMYRDIFACFGLDLTRNVTSGERSVLKNYDISGMSDEEKIALIKTLPPGTELNMPSHETVYLGYEGDSIFVISNSSRIRQEGVSQSRSRGCIINDVTSAGGTTWLRQMNYATVPYYLHDEEMPEVEYKKDPEAPAAPVISTSANASAKKVSVSWKKISGATDYRVWYREAGKTNWTRKWANGKTSYTITGLKSGRLYDIKVCSAEEKDGSIIYSDDSNIACVYMRAVTALKAKAGKNKISLSWKANSKASKYKVVYSASSSMKNSRSAELKGSASSYTIKGLKSGKKYYIKVTPYRTYKGVTYKGAPKKISARAK